MTADTLLIQCEDEWADVVLPDKQDLDRSLFLPAKYNIGKTPKGLSFRREPIPSAELDTLLRPYAELSAEDRQRLGETVFRIKWEGETEVTADEQLADAMRSERSPKKVERCAHWMKVFLAKYAYPSDEMLAAANAPAPA